jgi:predicted N-acetyltransferase YhbS
MTLLRRDFASVEDYLAMQSLTQRVWPRNPRWHVGEVAWSRTSVAGAASRWRTSLWQEDDTTVAWGWAELPGELSLAVDPRRLDLIAEVIRWFDRVTTAGEQTCMVLETESALVEALTGAGFSAAHERPFFRYHTMTLDALEEPTLPDGFVLRHVDFGEAEPRARVHRAGWSDFGSKLSTQAYADVMAAWPYRPDLDWVVVAPDGEMVASALGWLDEVNRSGLLEPVGCAPAYRRRGLARAVNLACLHALRDAGAETGHVNPRGDDGYPVPSLLYRSIGFEPGPRTITYVRTGTSALRNS